MLSSCCVQITRVQIRIEQKKTTQKPQHTYTHTDIIKRENVCYFSPQLSLSYSPLVLYVISFCLLLPGYSVSTVAYCSYRLHGEEENINHLTCRRKPDVFPLHLSGAAVRASVKV